VEYCDNLIFHRRAALDRLDHRLLDANRSIGQASKITTIFGRRVTKYYKGKLQTVIEDLDLPNPVICTHYAYGSLKQYVRDHLCLRTEPATNDLTAYGVKKAVENLPQLREKLSAVCDNYLNVQQDILESFADRGQLHNLTQPSVLPSGKRIPGTQTRPPTTTGSHARPGLLRSPLLATPSLPPNFIPRSWLLCKCQPTNTVWLPFATIYANWEPSTRSKNSPNCVAIGSARRATPFAWCFSNSSNAFIRRWLPAYFNLTGLTPNSRTTNQPSWIGSIKRLQMISISFSMLLASRLPEQREQSSRKR
jgi:hypothetical protein